MNLPSPPACPNCHFEIFNRRYPRCESCGIELPQTLVYSPAERQALLVADEAESTARRRSSSGDDDLTLAPFDAAVVSGFVALTED